MTTQVLMSSNQTLSEAATINSVVSATEVEASISQAATQTAKLPYQANHQVELLHLQAEIEALLQQLTTLKQQRTSSEHEQTDAVEAPVLVAR